MFRGLADRRRKPHSILQEHVRGSQLPMPRIDTSYAVTSGKSAYRWLPIQKVANFARHAVTYAKVGRRPLAGLELRMSA